MRQGAPILFLPLSHLNVTLPYFLNKPVSRPLPVSIRFLWVCSMNLRLNLFLQFLAQKVVYLRPQRLTSSVSIIRGAHGHPDSSELRVLLMFLFSMTGNLYLILFIKKNGHPAPGEGTDTSEKQRLGSCSETLAATKVGAWQGDRPPEPRGTVLPQRSGGEVWFQGWG